MAFSAHLHQRLLRDIDELCRKPYPNIELYVHGDDLTNLCLVLSPEGWEPMHLTITKLSWYPLFPPRIRMDSDVQHPNVFGGYICASILNDDVFYTPAYTLKSIAIQMLSFFASENIEQEGGEVSYSIEEYRQSTRRSYQQYITDGHSPATRHYTCKLCGFGKELHQPKPRQVPGATWLEPDGARAPARKHHNRGRSSRKSDSRDGPIHRATEAAGTNNISASVGGNTIIAETTPVGTPIKNLPSEILLVILKNIDDSEELANFARAWSRISNLMRDFDVLRQRDLQCFVLKKTYHDVKLGVGVAARAGIPLASEFDLLSQDAYSTLRIYRSVHGIGFNEWLPLPISRRHWRLVKDDATNALEKLKIGVKLEQASNAQVLYSFMTDIVIKLNAVNMDRRNFAASASTLRHASEKAIESYFHLFHLLVCLATDHEDVIHQANKLLTDFASGKTTKKDCPNLGHLLVALLISDVKVTEELMRNITTEAITRNVVWLLDHKGNNSPELSYMETDEVSAYRLDKTFEGSRTSYRLLMFSELFRRIARPDQTSLSQVREELFDRHGGPPSGAASHLAAEVRRLHNVNDFPQFLREMGIYNIPSPQVFTAVLRKTVRDSVTKGYSIWGLSQPQALALRLAHEPGVGIQDEFKSWAQGVRETSTLPLVNLRHATFFPGRKARGANVSGNQESDRGSNRGANGANRGRRR